MLARGVDVSDYQSNNGSSLVHWPKLAAQGFRFAIAKAGEAYTTQRAFASHVAGIVNAGMYAGAYWYFHPKRDAVRQAKAFAATVAGAPLWLPPAVDVEDDNGLSSVEVTAQVRTFLSQLRVELDASEGPKGLPLFYTYPYFAGLDHHAEQLASEADLWISHPGAAQPLVPSPFKAKGWKFWQTTADVGPVRILDGYPGHALVDVFNGTDADLDDYVRHHVPNNV